MSDRLESLSRHVPDDLLLRFLDGELPPTEVARIRDHLQACWECRLRAERLSNTILRFVEHCDVVVEDRGGFPDTRQGFRLRLRGQAASDVPPKANWFRGFLRVLDTFVPQPGAATAGIAILVVLWWTFFGASVPSASAEELLNRSCQSESKKMSANASKVIHQRLELASGAERVEWELWHEPQKKRFLKRWSRSTSLASELHEVYARNRWDEQHPLSATAFAAWRSSLPERREKVTQTEQQLKVQTWTASSLPGSIREASLMLRPVDLHPIEKQLVVTGATADREYRIREISFAVVAPEDVPAGIFPPEVRPIPLPQAIPPMAAERATAASAEDLESAEVSVRAALHEAGLDTRLIPEFERDRGKLIVRLIAESGEQRERISAEFSRIAHVEAHVFDPESAAEWPQMPDGQTDQRTLFRSDPPLNRPLMEYFGSLELANNYLNQVHRAFRALLPDALALERLIDRYPDAARVRLGVDSLETLEQVGGDHHAVIARIWPVASELLKPVLEEMRKRRNLPAAPALSAEACQSALESGARWAAHLRRLESDFNALFVVREQQDNAAIDTDPTLQNAESLRRALDEEARYPCRP